jgi:hypothetical protein
MVLNVCYVPLFIFILTYLVLTTAVRRYYLYLLYVDKEAAVRKASQCCWV